MKLFDISSCGVVVKANLLQISRGMSDLLVAIINSAFDSLNLVKNLNTFSLVILNASLNLIQVAT
jgi:hypothetical protein